MVLYIDYDILCGLLFTSELAKWISKEDPINKI